MLIFALVMSGNAAAARPGAGDAAAVRGLAECRKLVDGTARLACYDKAIGAFEAARVGGELVIVDRDQVHAMRRRAFGLALPSLDILPRRRGEDARLQQVTLKLVAASHDSSGRWSMRADDGAEWQQTDSQDILNSPHGGSELMVRSGALGSYFCKVDGQSAVRCQRLR